MAHNDYFRVYDGNSIAAETYHPSNACTHADRVAFHGGNARIVVVTKDGEDSTALPINPDWHVCNRFCKKRKLGS